MIIDYLGKFMRLVPPIKGKARLAQALLGRVVRNKGYVCTVQMRAPGGGKLICKLEDWIPWNVYVHGRYEIERNCESFMLNVARDAATIVDIGANIGYYTVQFARLGKGQCIAFEPMSYQFDTLRKNIDLNRLNNVRAMKYIVSDEPGSKRIYFSGRQNTGASSIEVITSEFEDVQAITIDQFVREEKIPLLDLVKVDVEGHELHVLKGMSQLLSAGGVRDLFLEINASALSTAGTSPREVCVYLEGYGYLPYSIDSGRKKRYAVGHEESLVYFCRDCTAKTIGADQTRFV